MKKIWESIINDKVKLSIYILLLAVVLFLLYSFFVYYFYEVTFAEMVQGGQIEFFGLLFDAIILVWLFNYISAIGDKNLLIQRYKDELDDYRNWNAPEAKQRVGGIIRRLEQLVDWRTIDIDNLHLGGCSPKYVARALNEKLEICSLEGINLSKAFIEKDDVNVDFLEKASFSKTNLQESNLFQTNLKGAVFLGANMEGTNLRRANLNKAQILNSNLLDADLSRANLQAARLVATNCGGANLRRANLQDAIMVRASLKGTILSKANLQKSNLEDAICIDVYSEEANLQGANLKGANLQGAQIYRSNFIEADFSNANLEGADLFGANLLGAKFNETNLQGTKLWGVSVIGKSWIERLKELNVIGFEEIKQKYYVDLSTEVKFCDLETKEERSYFKLRSYEETVNDRKERLIEESKVRYRRPKGFLSKWTNLNINFMAGSFSPWLRFENPQYSVG